MKTYVPLISQHDDELAQAMLFFLDAVAIRSRSATGRTIMSYSDVLWQFLQFSHQHSVSTLEQVTPAIINRYLLMKRPNVSLHTLLKHYAILHAFWNWCMSQELVDKDIFRKVEKPRPPVKTKPALTEEQVNAILKACEGRDWTRLRDKALVLFLMDTGARASEVHGVKVADVSKSTIVLRGKGSKERMAFLSNPTRLAILKYLKACPFHPAPDQPLWWGKYGRPLTWHGILEVVEDIGKRAGISPLGCHVFRRTFATWSLRAGIDLHRLQLLMGHSDMRTTQHYLSTLEDDLREAHQKFSPVRHLKT